MSKRENDTTSKKVRGESIKTLQAKSNQRKSFEADSIIFQNIQLLSINKKLKSNPKPIVTGKILISAEDSIALIKLLTTSH